ncbi:VWA domain-containing protein [Geobacillus stearothermophilus]|uniref:vWA domain-containing protein n=1 Tax=Geobacillus TaxID=129337 RepID=UPI001621E36B|nr:MULTISPECIES: VWA domain-containing protein [Geobacillus]MED3668576.1 VWA domain-containing protein [Geobacillus kaustophilus]MED3721353.1 VWA domain-containing protein [Geobacillus stearothermophilus]MED5076820.1 VWA domain-containing protein [Geobacillus stearothermophilus]
MTFNIPTLEGNIAKRTLQFFWLADCSGSMSGAKIASLNQAIRESIPEIQAALASHPEVQVMMRAIKFSDMASWHVGPAPVSIENFVWPELRASGLTATAQAINLLCEELDIEKMNRRGLPPVCILLSDGFCTDPEEEYDRAIQRLKSLPWGKRAVRLVIAIGDEHEYDEQELLKFVSHSEIGVLKAHTAQQLVQYIKWASVTATVGASVGKSYVGSNNPSTPVALPTPPVVQTTSDDDLDVF